MDNIYNKLYNNVQLLNNKINYNTLNDLIKLEPPAKDLIWKESAKNKKYKNLITDTFLDRDYNLNDPIDRLVLVNDKLFIRTYKYLGLSERFQSFFSTDGLMTYVKQNIDSRFTNLGAYPYVSNNKMYYVDQSKRNLFYTDDLINAKLLYNNSKYDIYSNHLFISNYDEIYIFFPHVDISKPYKINEKGQLVVVNIEGSTAPDMFGSRIDNQIISITQCDGKYISNTFFGNIVVSENGSDFICVNNRRTTDSVPKICGSFKSGLKLAIKSVDPNTLIIYTTNDFNNFNEIFRLDSNLNLTDPFKAYPLLIESVPRFFKIIDNILYICLKDAIYYSKDYGKTWDKHDIQNSLHIEKWGENILVCLSNGVLLIENS
ncbi:MAG: hypothetical protein K2X69_09060 [Silvanigrellaceae bacterium]|nr:hypothetical protein [Silvanigrellaceae bacterium]